MSSDPHQPLSSSVSGVGHPRDSAGCGHNPAPGAQRQRLSMHDDNAALAYKRPHVLCFVASNHRGCFYIPCKRNSFGGVPVDNVLLDSGCSSLLLPYPLVNGFPPELLNPAQCNWVVSSSRGTGAWWISMHSCGQRTTRLGFVALSFGKRGLQQTFELSQLSPDAGSKKHRQIERFSLSD